MRLILFTALIYAVAFTIILIVVLTIGFIYG